MAVEIERKFLVVGDEWKKPAEPELCRQGYISTVKERVVRVRTIGERGYINIKGVNEGISRLEFKYEIPFAEAEELIEKLCEKPIIEKYRYTIDLHGSEWYVDEFLGFNEGLVVAEIELTDENEKFEKPEWLGSEITGDVRYYNSSLTKKPYCNFED